MATDAEFVFQQEIREKKRAGIGIFSRVSTRKGGSGKLKTPTAYYTNKQLEQLHGEVVTYNMFAFLTYEEFIKKDKEEQRKIMIYWRDNFTTQEVMDGMKTSSYLFYKLLADLDIPRNKSLVYPNKREATKEEMIIYRNTPISYSIFKSLVVPQQHELAKVYLKKFMNQQALADFWDVKVSTVYTFFYEMRKTEKKRKDIEKSQEKANEQKVREQKELKVAVEIAEPIEEVSAQATPLPVHSYVQPTALAPVAPVVMNLGEAVKQYEKELKEEEPTFTFALNGTFDSKALLKRLNLLASLLEEEDCSYNVKFNLAQNK